MCLFLPLCFDFKGHLLKALFLCLLKIAAYLKLCFLSYPLFYLIFFLIVFKYHLTYYYIMFILLTALVFI